MNLGIYENEKQAALVYDAAAYILFKGTGYYNYPDLCPDPEALRLARDRIEHFKAKKSRTSDI